MSFPVSASPARPRPAGLAVLCALCLGLAAPPLMAGEGGDSRDSMTGGASGGLSSATTKRVVQILNRDFERCARLKPIYQYDCYRDTYKFAADAIAGNAAYREAFQALSEVEKTLERVVAENRDPAVRPLRRGFRTYQPIKPAAVPKAKRQTTQALQKAETVLLRSPESKQKHFARIADAVNSNKVLLRSAFLDSAPVRMFAKAFKSLARALPGQRPA